LTYFHGRRFNRHHLNVTLTTRETQLHVGDEKGKVGGKGLSNDNILLDRADIVDMAERDDIPMELWGDIDFGKAFVTEPQGEGRKSHFARGR
jgi:hypothetical protein